MVPTSSPLSALVRATGRMYLRTTRDAGKCWVSSLRYVPLQLGVILLVTLALRLTGFGSSFGGQLLLSLCFAFLAAGYLGTIEAGILGEKRSLHGCLERAQQLFSPTLSVFFAFFLLNFIASHLLARPEQHWLLMSCSMALAVVFNVAPEAIYSSRGVANPLAVSLEFMTENFVEWSLPWALVLALLWLFLGGDFALASLLALITTNPLELPRFLLSFGAVAFSASGFVAFLGVLLVINFSLLWRGILFRDLAQSTRRKRLYEERVRG